MLNQVQPGQTSVSTRPANPATTVRESQRDGSPISTRIILTQAPNQYQQKTRAGLKAIQNSFITPNITQPVCQKQNSCEKIQNSEPNSLKKEPSSQRKRKRDCQNNNVVYSILDEQSSTKRKDTNIRLVKSSKKSQKQAQKEFDKIIDWFENHHAQNLGPHALKHHYNQKCKQQDHNNELQQTIDRFTINGIEYMIKDLSFKEIKKDKVTSLVLKKQQTRRQQKKALGYVYKLVKHDQPNVNEKNLQKQCEWLRNEHEIISRLNHPAIMKSLGYYPSVMINGQHQCGMLMEEANQDLKKLIWDIEAHKLESHNLHMKDIKSVFRQILEPVRYLHSLGLSHNDLKMDNFFAFKINQTSRYKKIGDYQFKLADFEMARHRSQIQSYRDLQQYWKLVNISYSGPEVFELIYQNSQMKYEEQKNDIFQLGLILFKMLFKNFKPQVNYNSNQKAPFLHFQNDPVYRNLINRNYDAFWNCEIHQSYWSQYEDVDGKATQQKIQYRARRLKVTYQRQFEFYMRREPKDVNYQTIQNLKDLINRMLAYNPTERPSIEEILQHPWFN